MEQERGGKWRERRDGGKLAGFSRGALEKEGKILGYRKREKTG